MCVGITYEAAARCCSCKYFHDLMSFTHFSCASPQETTVEQFSGKWSAENKEKLISIPNALHWPPYTTHQSDAMIILKNNQRFVSVITISFWTKGHCVIRTTGDTTLRRQTVFVVTVNWKAVLLWLNRQLVSRKVRTRQGDLWSSKLKHGDCQLNLSDGKCVMHLTQWS